MDINPTHFTPNALHEGPRCADAFFHENLRSSHRPCSWCRKIKHANICGHYFRNIRNWWRCRLHRNPKGIAHYAKNTNVYRTMHPSPLGPGMFSRASSGFFLKKNSTYSFVKTSICDFNWEKKMCFCVFFLVSCSLLENVCLCCSGTCLRKCWWYVYPWSTPGPCTPNTCTSFTGYMGLTKLQQTNSWPLGDVPGKQQSCVQWLQRYWRVAKKSTFSCFRQTNALLPNSRSWLKTISNPVCFLSPFPNHAHCIDTLSHFSIFHYKNRFFLCPCYSITCSLWFPCRRTKVPGAWDSVTDRNQEKITMGGDSCDKDCVLTALPGSSNVSFLFFFSIFPYPSLSFSACCWWIRGGLDFREFQVCLFVFFLGGGEGEGKC